MGTLTLTGLTPVTLASGKVYPLEVYNIGGAGLCYASRSPGVTPNNADYTIGPNGKISVPPGVTLYVCTGDNTTSNIFWHADGTAYATGSTFTQASNSPILIGEIVLDTSQVYTNLNLSGLDISSYASVLLVATVSSPAPVAPLGLGTPANPYTYFSCILMQSANGETGNPTPAAPDLLAYNPEFLLVTPANSYLPAAQSFHFPVERPMLGILPSFQYALGYKPPAGTLITLSLYGSGQTIAQPKYIQQGNGINPNLPLDRVYSGGRLLGTGGINIELIASTNGPAVIGYYPENAGATGGMRLSTIQGGIVQSPFVSVVSTASVAQLSALANTNLPYTPLQAVSQCTGAGGAGTGTVTI